MWVNTVRWHCWVTAWQPTSQWWTKNNCESWPLGSSLTPPCGSAGSSGMTLQLCVCGNHHHAHAIWHLVLIIKRFLKMRSTNMLTWWLLQTDNNRTNSFSLQTSWIIYRRISIVWIDIVSTKQVLILQGLMRRAPGAPLHYVLEATFPAPSSCKWVCYFFK